MMITFELGCAAGTMPFFEKGTVSFASSLFFQEARFAAYSLVAWQHKKLQAFQFAMILPECRYAPMAPAVHVKSHLLSAF